MAMDQKRKIREVKIRNMINNKFFKFIHKYKNQFEILNSFISQINLYHFV